MDELKWTTGAVGSQHRAIMRGGRVIAIADDMPAAAHIVRTMNGVEAAREDRLTLSVVRDGLAALRERITATAMTTQDLSAEIERLMKVGQE